MTEKMNASIFGAKKDALFMSKALVEAQKAFAKDEVPIGAIVVDSKETIIGRGYNSVERKHSQLEHAEARAIDDASKKCGDWRLNDCWLYVTLEPCTMCMGLVRLSRLAGVIYGASSPIFGFRLDNNESLWVYKRDALVEIDGVCGSEATTLLKKFFQKKREKR